MNKKHGLLVVDDRTVLVEGIVTVTSHTYPALRIVAHSPVVHSELVGVDVAILGGAALQQGHALRLIERLIDNRTPVVALLDAATEPEIDRLARSGVLAFVAVSEGLTELLRAIETVFTGAQYVSPDARLLITRPARVTPPVSPRERQIVMLYLSENDWSVDDVAALLQISAQTVRSHLARLRSHFSAAGHRVHNRLELRQTLLQLGVLTLDDLAAGSAESSRHLLAS